MANWVICDKWLDEVKGQHCVLTEGHQGKCQHFHCRPPKQLHRHRLRPSAAYPVTCPGCGYNFASEAKLADHRRAWERIKQCQ